MKWQRDKDGYSSARVTAGTSLDEAMGYICLQIIGDVLPRNRDVDWDHLRVEVWADSGRVIVFPASMKTPYRVDKAGCQVTFDDLLQRFLDWADLLDDVEFDTRMKTEERRWFGVLLQSARETELRGVRMILSSARSEPIEDVVV